MSDNRRSSNWHGARMTEAIAHEAATFIVREAGNDSLITVLRARSSSHNDTVTVFVSVFPIEKAQTALSFLDRQREDFSNYLKSRVRLGPLPRIAFALDPGEINRQRLDELSEKP